MIKPTVGRVVWFHQFGADSPIQAAIVCKVISDTQVNLVTFTEYGVAIGAMNVRLLQPGEAPEENVSYCEWMPYQLGQAARTEAAEAAAHGSAPR